MKQQTVKKLLFKSISLYVLSSLLVFASNGTGATGGGSKGMTWDEINISSVFKANFPTFEIDNYPVRYDELCLATPEIIQTKHKYLIGWTKVSDTYFYQYDFLTRPKDIVKRVCVDTKSDGQCVWEEIVDSIPEELDINIHQKYNGEWILDDTRNYKLDYCENVRTIFI